MITLKNIVLRRSAKVLLDSATVTVNPSEKVGLVGRNGAGKSTLMNVVYGLLQPDEGSISVDGREIKINSPLDALAAGIGMVHQHFMLIPVFTVAENIVLGHEKTKRFGILDCCGYGWNT